MTQQTLNDEAKYFDSLNKARKASIVYPEIDIRSEDILLSKDPTVFPCDPHVRRIFSRLHTIALAALKTSNGDSLDVCCGPGWLVLEQARSGYNATGVDLSAEAIHLALEYAKTQSSKLQEKIHYEHQSVEQFLISNPDISLGCVTGWSAFHHLLSFNITINSLLQHSKPGCLYISYDDLEYDPITILIRKVLLFALPIRSLDYIEKIKKVAQYMLRPNLLFQNSIDSPAEIQADKYHSGALDIEVFFHEFLSNVQTYYEGGFAEAVSYQLRIKSNTTRAHIAHALLKIERFLLHLSIIKPRFRLLIGYKPNT